MGSIIVTIRNPDVSAKQLAAVVKKLDIAEQMMLAYDVDSSKTGVTEKKCCCRLRPSNRIYGINLQMASLRSG